MWLEINSALAAEGQHPSQWQAQPEASTKKDKRDLWLSAMIAVASLFFTGRLDHLHTSKAGVTLGDLQMLQKATCGFQTPDLQLQIQDDDLTYF